MNAFKLSAIATLLAGAALSASAMTSIDDSALSQVSGQDGVSIAGDLHVKGDFTWSNTSITNKTGSINFKTEVSGIFGVAIDVLNQADAVNATAVGLRANYGMTDVQTATALGALQAATFQTYNGSQQATADAAKTAAYTAVLTGGGTVAQATAAATVAYAGALTSASFTDTSFGFGTTDVVQFAFPKLNPAALGAAALSVKVTPSVLAADGSTKTFGTFEMKNLDLSGTKIAIWAH